MRDVGRDLVSDCRQQAVYVQYSILIAHTVTDVNVPVIYYLLKGYCSTRSNLSLTSETRLQSSISPFTIYRTGFSMITFALPLLLIFHR